MNFTAMNAALPQDLRYSSLRRWSTRSLVFLALVALLLVALRVAAPYWVKNAINDTLHTMGDYHGTISDVDLHLWRGAYTIRDLLVQKASAKIPVPFLQAPRVDISLSWRDIFRGAVVGDVLFEGPELNFVDGLGTAEGQTGRGVDWRAELEALVPIQLNEVHIRDGTVAFRAFKTSPPVNMSATDFDAVITNLTNVRGEGGNRVAHLVATATVLKDAPLESNASFDPFGTLEDFVFDLRVLKIHATRLNPFLQAYARLDVASGTGDFAMELEATDGNLKGYAKPLFQDLDVLSWEQDVKQQKDNPLRLAWEAAAAGVMAIFKNHKSDQFATRIPIKGNLKNPEMSRWDALAGILRNAFVEAFRPQLEKTAGK